MFRMNNGWFQDVFPLNCDLVARTLSADTLIRGRSRIGLQVN